MSDTVSVRKDDLDVLVAAVTTWAPGEMTTDAHEAFSRMMNAFDEAHAGEHAPAEPQPEPPVRYALVEQMGRRSTTATVREVAFLGAPMLEVTDLRTGSVHLISPQSLYEVTWLTEDDARARAKPWTATAITAGQQLAYDEDAEADDLDDEADGDGERDAARRMDALDEAARLEAGL